MSLYIEEAGSVTLPFDTAEIAIAVTEAALDYAECPYEAEINLLLTENQEIHEMNLEQRGIDRPTVQKRIHPKETSFLECTFVLTKKHHSPGLIRFQLHITGKHYQPDNAENTRHNCSWHTRNKAKEN